MEVKTRHLLLTLLFCLGWILVTFIQFGAILHIDVADDSDDDDELDITDYDPNINLEASQQEVTVTEVDSDKNVSSFDESLNGVVSVIVADTNEEDIESQGSGFLYTEDYIVTNEHVTSNGDNIYVQFKNGEWSEAVLVGEDQHTDLAVLQAVDKPEYAEQLPIQTNLPERGDQVTALGSPESLDNTITTGIVSGIERSMPADDTYNIPDLIQTDAALNPGNSGGPLINQDDSSVVGVNRATEGENLGFAISGRITKEVATSIIETGDHEHPLIGVKTVEMTPLTDDTPYDDVHNGIIVEDVSEDGPSDGVLQDGDKPDVIKYVDDSKITSTQDLASHLILNTEPGDTISLTVKNDDGLQTVEVTVESR